MKLDFLRVTGVVLLMVFLSAGMATAQELKPVQIAFDDQSKRMDLRTGKAVPNYTTVERESLQFFLGRLDHPDTFFNFYHDGWQKANPGDLKSMEKIQEQFGIWRLRYKSGAKNTPRVQHQAVSFIPIGPDGKRGERVCVLLKDLRLIDWSE